MSNNVTTRIPVSDDYVCLVGKAVYIFSYYEWIIIWIIENLKNGFLREYSRGRPLVSAAVKAHLLDAIENQASFLDSGCKAELIQCAAVFGELIVRRNALIHAHPASDANGNQLLVYQTSQNRELPDAKWPTSDLIELIINFDEAACEAGRIREKLQHLPFPQNDITSE